MKIVAYYHEETDERNVTRKSVGLEQRVSVIDEPCVLEREALARIGELDLSVFQLNNSVTSHHWENHNLRAELAALKAQEPVAWFTDDRESDKSATTYDKAVAERWKVKGWPVGQLYAAPVVSAEPSKSVVVGWRRTDRPDSITPYSSVCATWLKMGAPVDAIYAAYPAPSTTEGQGDE